MDKLCGRRCNVIQVACIGVLFLYGVCTLDFERHIEDYPSGFVSNCSGLWKPAVINPKSLYIYVMGSGPAIRARLKPYNYYQMKKLVKHPNINFKNKTFLYVGNHVESTTLPLVRIMGQLYRDMGYNVLIFNMPELTKPYYPEAASFVRPVGRHVAEMLASLTSLGLDPNKLELLGQSLGGQTMSFIAKSYRQITGRNISSLTGLDPAGPCFRHLGPDERLDPSDADFVLSMATNIDGFGIATPVGHATFYVNGGEFQVSHVWFLPCGFECSSVKSFNYWISALINPHTFIGVQCDTIQQAREGNCYNRTVVWNSMDLFTDRSKPGIYFLPTHNRYPYGIGMKGLKKGKEPVFNYLNSLNDAEVLTL